MKLRAGIVKHVNARPLTFGFENDSNIHSVYETPAVLKDYLLKNELDFALVSSVEILRHSDLWDYCPDVGVCAKDRVRSILFYKNKTQAFPPDKIYCDSGSRSSVALLQTLIRIHTGHIVTVESTPAEEIRVFLDQGKGSHLLFGNNAMTANVSPDQYEVIDLATWWNNTTGLSFVFAFWAFPKGKNFPSTLFRESLEYGWNHLEDIYEQEKEKFSRDVLVPYFTEELHFLTTKLDLDGFRKFESYLRAFDLL